MKSVRKPSAELIDLLSGCAPQVVHLALALRELVLGEAPEAEEVLYSVYAEVIVFRFPARKRGAFCYVAAYARHVNPGFYFGADLPDPHRALEGSGKKMRHIRFVSPEDLRRPYLADYVRAAIERVGSERASPRRGRAKR